MLKFKKNILLSEHTTFKIGGPAKYFCIVKNVDDIKEAIKMAKKENLPFFILGNGSNILAGDEGYDGIIIQLKITNCEFKKNKIIADAGLLLKNLILKSADANLGGLEWAAGIPGTVGGGIYGNCGAYGHSLSESIIKIKTLNPVDFKIRNYTNKDCKFAYRESIFKKNKEIILEAEFKLKNGDQKEIKKNIKEILETRKKIPKLPSAGSVFKNIYSLKGEKIPAGYLIEQCGLKGKTVGGAKISESHANFIVNFNNAKSADILALINLCKKEVKKKFVIDLQTEIQLIDF